MQLKKLEKFIYFITKIRVHDIFFVVLQYVYISKTASSIEDILPYGKYVEVLYCYEVAQYNLKNFT